MLINRLCVGLLRTALSGGFFVFCPKLQQEEKMKLKKLLTVFAVMVAFAFVLAGCGDPTVKPLDGTATVVIDGSQQKVYTVDLKKNGFTTEDRGWDLVIWLADNEELSFTASSSAYGKYFTSIGELREDAASYTYISVYTSVEKDFSTYEPVLKVDYEGKTLTMSGVGISGMHLESGCVIYFTTKYPA